MYVLKYDTKIESLSFSIIYKNKVHKYFYIIMLFPNNAE